MTHGVDNHPSWSPEGSFVAFDARGPNVQVVSPTGGVPIRIGPAELTLPAHAYPSWSPDGSAVILSGGETVYSVDLPSGSLTVLFSKEGYSVRAFNHSSDGSRVVARIYPGEDVSEGDIWLIPLDGGEPMALTDFPGRESTPHYSPDGTKIAFTSDRGGSPDIWVMEVDLEALKNRLGLRDLTIP